jgi:polysaccharide pyruvyl transferase WcaK-like protein
MGVNTAGDQVHPDLAFALDLSSGGSRSSGAVGVGVMDYRGGNDDRAHAEEIRARYLQRITEVVRRLLSEGREVRLFIGDEADNAVVSEIITDVRTRPDGLDPSRLVGTPATDLISLMRQMTGVDLVVATRYHNVLTALAASRPTVSISYAAKNDVLMATMGLADFCQPVKSFDVDRLFEQIEEIELRRDDVQRTLAENTARASRHVTEVLTELTAALLPVNHRRNQPMDPSPARLAR